MMVIALGGQLALMVIVALVMMVIMAPTLLPKKSELGEGVAVYNPQRAWATIRGL